MSNPEKGHNAKISKPMETLSEERLMSVTGGRDDENIPIASDITEEKEYQPICIKGLMDPNKPGELRNCYSCEYLTPLNACGYK